MGLEIVATALSANPLYQAERSREAGKQQRRAADLQEEANAQNQAQQAYERKQAIKQQLRQQRVRRAQVESAAQAAGVSGASIEATTIGVDQTLTAAGQAFASGQSITNQNISNLSQQAADARSSAAFDLAQGQMGAAVGQAALTAFSMFAPGGGITATTASGTSLGKGGQKVIGRDIALG